MANDKTQELEARLEAMEALVAEQAETIEKMEATKAKSSLKTTESKPEPKPEVPEKTFKVGGAEYKFKYARFWYKEEKVLAADAINNTKLLKELVEEAPGVLEQL